MRPPTSSPAGLDPAPAYRISDREIAFYIKEAQALRRQAIADWVRRGGAFLRRAIANASRRVERARATSSPIAPSSVKARP